MLPYWVLFLAFALPSISNTHHADRSSGSRWAFGAAAALIILIVGFRYQVGGDWGAYQRMFDGFRYRDLIESLSVGSSEPSYSLLNWVAVQLGLSIEFVNTVCAAIFGIGLVSFIRREPLPWLCLLVATPFLIIVVAMGYTRQSAAIGLFLIALSAVQRHRVIYAIFLILLAASFHRSALIALPLVGLSYVRSTAQGVMLSVAAALIGYYTLVASQIDRLTYSYIEQEYQSAGASTRILMNAIPALLYLAMWKKFDLSQTERRLWLGFSIAALVSLTALYFTDATVALDRLALYILPIQLLVLGRLPMVIAPAGAGRVLITLTVIVYSAIVQFTWLSYADHAQYWLPYRSSLFEWGD